MMIALKKILRFNKMKTRQNAYKALCSLRTAGVMAIAESIRVKELFRAEERRKAKASEILPENVTIKLPNTYDEEYDKAISSMKDIGQFMFLMLDEWQRLGGTFGELCNLCNISEEKGRQITSPLEKNERDFAQMVFICNLDYKEKGDFLIDTPNAPFTLCIKEYMFDIMINTARGRKASHEALQAVFPDIWGSIGNNDEEEII